MSTKRTGTSSCSQSSMVTTPKCIALRECPHSASYLAENPQELSNLKWPKQKRSVSSAWYRQNWKSSISYFDYVHEQAKLFAQNGSHTPDIFSEECLTTQFFDSEISCFWTRHQLSRYPNMVRLIRIPQGIWQQKSSPSSYENKTTQLVWKWMNSTTWCRSTRLLWLPLEKKPEWLCKDHKLNMTINASKL